MIDPQIIITMDLSRIDTLMVDKLVPDFGKRFTEGYLVNQFKCKSARFLQPSYVFDPHDFR